MTTLIAEISNMHYGSVSKAKELIQAAKEAGADLVKSQAFYHKDMRRHGVMSEEFYRKCSFSLIQHHDLILYARAIGVEYFCSIISQSFDSLSAFQKYNKITASQAYGLWDGLKAYDSANIFISMRVDIPVELQCAHIMYAEHYGGPFSMAEYKAIRKRQDRPIGISHHTKGWDSIEMASKYFSLPVVEKHFYLGDKIIDGRQVYRDCEHAATPQEFKELATYLKECQS